MMQHNKLLIFDLETIPDVGAARNLLGLGADSPDFVVFEKLREYHLNITDQRSDFVRQLFHKIVAISFAECDIERLPDGIERYHLNEIRSGGNDSSEEGDLVAGFFSKFNKIKPRLVSFNGRTFDIPVLKYRAMRHGVQAKHLFKAGDKWNNYHSRYSQDWHCDLIDAFSDYGASARVKMSEVSALLGIPCKTSVDGSMVHELYDANRLHDIRKYCEEDVVATYLQYLKYQHLNGTLTDESYRHCVEGLLYYLGNSEHEHFNDYALALAA